MCLPCHVLWFVVQSMADSPATSNMCAFWRVKGGPSAGKWFARLDCVGRHINPASICEMCVDKGMALLSGPRDPEIPPPARRQARITSGSVRSREALAGDFQNRRDRTSLRKDILTAIPVDSSPPPVESCVRPEWKFAVRPQWKAACVHSGKPRS